MSMFVYRGELLLGAKDCISSGVQTEFSCGYFVCFCQTWSYLLDSIIDC